LNRLLGKSEQTAPQPPRIHQNIDTVDALIDQMKQEIDLNPVIPHDDLDPVDLVIRRAMEDNELEQKYGSINTRIASSSDPGPAPKPFTLDEIHDETWCCTAYRLMRR
jgi:hypothetical protein